MNIRSILPLLNTFLIVLIVIYLVINSKSPQIAVQKAINSASTEQYSEVIQEYLMDHPEVIIQALEKYKDRANAEAMEKQKLAVKDNILLLVADKSDPFSGGESSSKVIVEYFDYMCGHCKAMLPVKEKLLSENKDVKIVFKELPILSEHSKLLSKAALAVYAIDNSKYFTIHKEFLRSGNKYRDLESIKKYITSLNINVDAFEKKFNSAEVEDKISSNIELAQKIGIRWTPAYVVDEQIIPGSITYEELLNRIQKSGN